MTDKALDNLVAHWVRPEIQGLSAYHVPEAQGLIKLDAMENPYTWPDELREQWLELMRQVDVNRYPHPRSPAVKAALRDAMDIPVVMDLVLGNGSDELIQMLAMTVGGTGRSILSVEPSFVMYRMIARFLGMVYVGVHLKQDDFSLDLEALLAAIAREQPALVFLAYPNNPTGNLFSRQALEQVLEAAPGLVVIDEAYAPFTDASFLPQLGDWPNLLVMRTVSKLGLAGLRLGLLAGPPVWLEQVEKTRLPYNINVLTQVTAAFALRHEALFRQQTQAIRAERAGLFRELERMDGVTAYPSEANFILIRLATDRALAVHRELQEKGILVKNLHGSHPLLAECLRITVGTPAENEQLLQALRHTLQ